MNDKLTQFWPHVTAIACILVLGALCYAGKVDIQVVLAFIGGSGVGAFLPTPGAKPAE